MVKIHLNVETDAAEFVSILSKSPAKYYLYNSNKKECVNAKSFLGIMYFMGVHPNETYLECDDSTAAIPVEIKKFIVEE